MSSWSCSTRYLLGFADWAGAGGFSLSAAFNALSTVLIVYPLLWEATTKFGCLSPIRP